MTESLSIPIPAFSLGSLTNINHSQRKRILNSLARQKNREL